MYRWMGRELGAFYEDRLRMDFAQLYRRLELPNVRWAHLKRWLGRAREHAWRAWRGKAQFACGMLGRALYAEHTDRIHKCGQAVVTGPKG